MWNPIKALMSLFQRKRNRLNRLLCERRDCMRDVSKPDYVSCASRACPRKPSDVQYCPECKKFMTVPEILDCEVRFCHYGYRSRGTSPFTNKRPEQPMGRTVPPPPHTRVMSARRNDYDEPRRSSDSFTSQTPPYTLFDSRREPDPPSEFRGNGGGFDGGGASGGGDSGGSSSSSSDSGSSSSDSGGGSDSSA